MSRLLTIFFLLIFFKSYPQNPSARIVVRNYSELEKGKYSIQLKWYSNRLFYNEGCKVYRRQLPSNDWVCVSKNLIKKKNISPEKLGLDKSELAKNLSKDITKDSALLPTIEVVNNTSLSNLKGVPLLLTMVKSFEHTSFAEYLGISFTDTSVQRGVSYQYKVVLPHQGSEDLLQKSAVVICGEYSPISPPKMFMAKLQDKLVGLKWQNETEQFFAVNIYRKSKLDSVFIKLNKEPFMDVQSKDKNGKPFNKDYIYIDRNVIEGFTYEYKILALDFFGSESLPSVVQSIVIPDKTPPIPPLNTTFKVESGTVYFKWRNPIQSDVKEYVLKRSTNRDGVYNVVKKVPVLDTSTFDVMEKFGMHYYKLTSIDIAGNESSTSIFPVENLDATPPAIPENVVATVDSGLVKLSWSKNLEKDFFGYRVYRSYSCLPNTLLLLNAKPQPQAKFEERLPLNRKGGLCYCVASLDSSLNVSKLSKAVILKIPDKVAPYKPFLKKVSQNQDSIRVEWILNQEKDILGYEVYSKSIQSTSKKINAQPISSGQNSFSFVPKNSNELIYVWIKAIDSTGNISQASDTLCLTLQPNTAKDIGLELKIKIYKKKLVATWQHQKNVQLKGYILFARQNKDQEMRPLSGIATLNKLELIEDKTMAEYQLRAYSQDGTVYFSKIVHK